jgi:hypothetical protein
MNCVWFELLSRIPFAGLRLRCCARHAEGCPRCLRESEAWAAPPLLITADQLPVGLDLRPGVKQGIKGLPWQAGVPGFVPPSGHRSWRWAYAAATIMLLLLAGFWMIVRGRDSGSRPILVDDRSAVQARVCSAKIGDRPARVFQVQSRNPNRTIFWIAKDNSRS